MEKQQEIIEMFNSIDLTEDQTNRIAAESVRTAQNIKQEIDPFGQLPVTDPLPRNEPRPLYPVPEGYYPQLAWTDPLPRNENPVHDPFAKLPNSDPLPRNEPVFGEPRPRSSTLPRNEPRRPQSPRSKRNEPRHPQSPQAYQSRTSTQPLMEHYPDLTQADINEVKKQIDLNRAVLYSKGPVSRFNSTNLKHQICTLREYG